MDQIGSAFGESSDDARGISLSANPELVGAFDFQ